MQKISRKKGVWIIAGLGLVCLCLGSIALGLNWWSTRGQIDGVRPIVWISVPTHHQVFDAGDPVPVQAYVHSDESITRLELWIDSRLVKNIIVDAGQLIPPTGLSHVWQGADAGTHSLVARAITADGVSGQATVLVDIVGQASDGFSYTVLEGDTLETIAEEVDQTVESIQAANPEVPSDGVSAGQELSIPGSDPGDGSQVADAEPVGTDEPAPDVLPDPAATGFAGDLFFFMQAFGAASDAEPVPLRIELLDLATQGLYESLHCYIAATGSLPRWYPDTDNDQTTDESFALNAEGSWNISEYYAGVRAPVIMWPGNENLSLDISCTGVVNGGAEAIQAGHLTLAIPVTQWDDQARWATSEVQEDGFLLKYKIGHTTPDGRGIPLMLDPSMTPPTNLILDDGVLRWSYIPDEEDEPIDGFLIYFNGNVVWTVPASTRAFDLPDEWLHPVCGTSYAFSVGSVIGDYPDSLESYQSNTVSIEPEPGNCNRQVRVTFLTLETHDMPSDGRYEDRSGDIRPIYGQFTANGRMLSFNTGSLGAGLDVAGGWNANTVYDLVEIAETNYWNLSAYPSLVVELGERSDFQYTFGMMDEDSGRCNDPDDPGCDDLVCAGASRIYESERELAELDSMHEVTIDSDNGRCSLTVRIEPTGEGASGTASGDLPFPLIWPDTLTYDEGTGAALVNFSNQGSAAWPDRNLEVSILTRAGEILQTQVLENYHLNVGGEDTLTAVLPDGMYDYCVVFDPNNLVTEEGELHGAFAEYRLFCLPQSDLIVDSVSFNRQTSNLEVVIRNRADNGFINRTLQLVIELNGEPDQFILEIPGYSLAGRTAATVLFPLTAMQRSQMMNINSEDGIGYTLTVNQNHRIVEENDGNNSVQVAEARNFSVAWVRGCSDAVVRGLTNHFTMSLSGSIGGEQIFNWDSPEHSAYLALVEPDHIYACWDAMGHYYEVSDRFLLMGDEALYIRASNRVEAGAEDYNLGFWDTIIDPNLSISFNDSNSHNHCNGAGADDIGNGSYFPWVHYPGEGDDRPDPGDWSSVVHVCRLQEGD